MRNAHPSTRRATLLVCLAYCWWGCSALFWRELESVSSVDQLSFRVTTGFGYLSLIWLYWRRNPLRSLTLAHVGYGLVATVCIGANWISFLWAVSNEKAVEASLGYFLMPLFAVALGVGLLGERLRRLQGVALVLALVGIVWTLVVVGSVPWIALSLGASFAVYGWARKQGPWQAVDGLTFETMLLTPFVLVMLGWRAAGDVNVVGEAANGSVWVGAMIALTGVVTIVPLLLFATAAKQVPLTVVGLLAYINPILQFVVGWQILGEDVSTGRLLGFAWIWAALVLVVLDELRLKGPVDGAQAGVGEGAVGSREGGGTEESTVRRKWRGVR